MRVTRQHRENARAELKAVQEELARVRAQIFTWQEDIATANDIIDSYEMRRLLKPDTDDISARAARRRREQLQRDLGRFTVTRDALGERERELRDELRDTEQEGEQLTTIAITDKGQNPVCALIITILPEELIAAQSAITRRGGRGSADIPGAAFLGVLPCASGEAQFMLGRSAETGNTVSATDTLNYLFRIQRERGRFPDYALLVGICAASSERKAALGDVVVPAGVFGMSTDKKKLTGRKDKYEGQATPLKPTHRLVKSAEWIGTHSDWSRHIVERRPDKSASIPHVHHDPLFSKSTFLEDGGKYMREVRAAINRKGLAYDMEAEGFGTACSSNDVPYLVIRGISDWADETAADRTWRPYAAASAAAFAVEFMMQGGMPR